MTRAYNFNAGPAALPEEVLLKAKQEWMDFKGTHMSVMELSHRSKEYDQVHTKATQLLKELMNIPDHYEVLFMQGGASLQFSMVPMNLLSPHKHASYVLTGSWSEKALKEASKIGQTEIISSTKDTNYTRIPDIKDISLNPDSAYLHITSNNTIYGTQWRRFPKTDTVPLVADMSSDILSRRINISDFGLIYAGAQKNLGPSGVTVVIIRKDLIKDNQELPTMLSYDTYATSKSLYNTPPTLAIYLLSLVLEWTKEKGGIEKIEQINAQKAETIYRAIDESDNFFDLFVGKIYIENFFENLNRFFLKSFKKRFIFFKHFNT